MKEGPDISIIAALIGNPASANMLMALMAGPALTATELAQEAGLMLSTASGHLAKLEDAGLVAVDRFVERRLLARGGDAMRVTVSGKRFFAKAGIDIDALERGRRPLCRPCLDWSERRSHLGGALGGAIFDRIIALGWAVCEARTRIVRFPAGGERKMRAWISG